MPLIACPHPLLCGREHHYDDKDAIRACQARGVSRGASAHPVAALSVPSAAANSDEALAMAKVRAARPDLVPGSTITATELAGPKGSSNGHGGGWEMEELRGEPIFTLRLMALDDLIGGREDHEVNDEAYWNKQVRAVVRDGSVDPVVATAMRPGAEDQASYLLDGHHRFTLAVQEDVTHLLVWWHAEGLS